MTVSREELEIGRDTFITTSRLHNQCETVCTLPEKGHKIPWGYNKFDYNEIISLRKESAKNSNAMVKNIGPEISVCKGGFSIDRNIILNCPNSPTSISPVSLPASWNYNIVPCLQQQQIDELRTSPSCEKQIVLSPQSRNSMMGSQFETKQWKVFSMETFSVDDKIGCIKERLGHTFRTKGLGALGPRRIENLTSMYWN